MIYGTTYDTYIIHSKLVYVGLAQAQARPNYENQSNPLLTTLKGGKVASSLVEKGEERDGRRVH